MVRAGSRIVMGATLFETPGLKRGIQISGLGIILIVLVVAAVGLMLYRHGGQRPGPSDPHPGDGWGNGPRPPDPPRSDRPPGGIPLDDAAPARVRLRGQGGLADKLPAQARRPAREPDRAPVRRDGAVPGHARGSVLGEASGGLRVREPHQLGDDTTAPAPPRLTSAPTVSQALWDPATLSAGSSGGRIRSCDLRVMRGFTLLP